MTKTTTFLLCLLLCLGLHGCKQEKEIYYERPESSEGAIYEVLAEDGRFELYLRAVDLVPSAERIKFTGSFTVFPPTDDAFNDYLKEKGVTFDELSAAQLDEIVSYSYMDFALSRRYLTLKSEWNTWTTDNYSAFRKETKYSRPIINEDGYALYNTPKYLPIFSVEYFTYMGGSGVEAETYNYLYSDIEYNKYGSDFNAAYANCLEKSEMSADNGFIYPVDKVLIPYNNIIEEIQSDDRVSSFAALFDKFVGYTYSESETEDRGSAEKLYYKDYLGERPQELSLPTTELEVDVNKENVLNSYTSQAPTYSSNTVFVPTNDALANHFAKYNGEPSRPALRYLINNHFIKDFAQYPYHLTKEGSQHKFLFDEGLVVEAKVLSNAVMYYINGILEPDLFKSAVAPAFLDEDYSMMMYALEKSGQTTILADETSYYSLFLLSDKYFSDNNITYDQATDTFLKDGVVWASDPTATTATSEAYVTDLVGSLIISGEIKGGFGKLSGTGDYLYFDIENNRILSDGVEVPFSAYFEAESGMGYTFVIDQLFETQEENTTFLASAYPKFSNLMTLSSTYIYDGYTAFVLPDDKIEYGTYPFEMIAEDGTIDYDTYPDGNVLLAERLKAYMVPEALFTTDASAFGSYETRLIGVSITFGASTILDDLGNEINITQENITKSGVIIHEIDACIKY
ncbi:MAG: hypothetical protein SNI51_02670 [Rikenellaceae bacterium]